MYNKCKLNFRLEGETREKISDSSRIPKPHGSIIRICVYDFKS